MRRMYSENQLLKAVEKESQENGLKVFENIVDKDGHARFIDEDITFETIEGVSKTYAKWSLSGTHLLIVIAGSVLNGTAIGGKTICFINVPDWIKDKIVPIAQNYVTREAFEYWSSGGTPSSSMAYLIKATNQIYCSVGSVTISEDKTFRIQFDLLIDND